MLTSLYVSKKWIEVWMWAKQHAKEQNISLGDVLFSAVKKCMESTQTK